MDPKGYTDRAAIESYLLQTIDNTFYVQIDEWIAAVEQYIDKQTGRSFIADEAASARLFEGCNSQKLLIDECIEVDMAEVGDTYGDSFIEIDEADHQLLPYNEAPQERDRAQTPGLGVGVHRTHSQVGLQRNRSATLSSRQWLAAGIVWGQ